MSEFYEVAEELEITKDLVLKDAIDNPFATIISMGGLSLYEFIVVFWNEISDDENEE